MTWTDQIGSLLKQYTSGGAAAAPAPDVHAHFDELAKAAPASEIADGLSVAFKSDKTPAFGQMLYAFQQFHRRSKSRRHQSAARLRSSGHPHHAAFGRGTCRDSRTRRRRASDARAGAEAFAASGPRARYASALNESFRR